VNQISPKPRQIIAKRAPTVWASGARGGRGRRPALILLAACVALLAAVPSASAVGSGSITGKVTEVKGSKTTAIAGAEVAVFTASGGFVTFANANGSGEYTASALAVGSYKVEFLAPEGSSLVGQYYKGKATLSDANPVSILTAGEKVSAINAELHEGAGISGTVTNAGHQGLENITVMAYPVGGGAEPPAAFAPTGNKGEYVITGLPSGSYEVEFAPAVGSGLDFAPQFWQASSSFSTAAIVSVTAGATTTAIDATLQPGGEIGGTVLDAVTHAPLANVLVSAEDVGEELFSTFAVTNAHGEYEITGLAGGSYRIGFFPENEGGIEYAPQYYNGASSPGPANLIEVRPESTLSGIGASLARAPLVQIAITLPPASSASGAPVSHAPPVPPAPAIALSTSELLVSGNSARVGIACASVPCSGAIEVSERVVVKQREGKRTISRRQTVVLARGSYVLAAGHSGTFKITLTATGRSRLARAPHHRLSATLAASVAGGDSAKRAVAMSEP